MRSPTFFDFNSSTLFRPSRHRHHRLLQQGLPKPIYRELLVVAELRGYFALEASSVLLPMLADLPFRLT